MAYKLKVKDKIYDLKDGFTIKEELNETLDSATGIEFETFHEEFIGVPFDHATIYDTENKIEEKHFLIDTYDDEVYSFEENAEENNHHYFVKLFSETKGIERITLPNLTVTQPIDASATKTTVATFLNKLQTLYIPLYRGYTITGSHYTYRYKYAYSDSLLSKFENVICPEFQWNNPTLREVMTDLLSTEDCIPVVKQGVISYYSLKEKGNPIDTSRLSYSKRTMSSGDFVGELSLNMKNAIGKSKTTACEYITLQAPEGSGTLTTENGVIKTQKPIYSIRKLVVYGYDENRYFHKLDITSRIKEYEDWNLLSNVRVYSTSYMNLPDWTDANGLSTKEHKVNYIYFERGKKEIHNINTKYNHVTLGSFNFMEMVVRGTFMNVLKTGGGGFPNGDFRNVFFYLEYETINNEQPLIAGKYLPSPHPDNRVFDAQKDSYVDLQHQSIFEYAKVERLGNKIREIYGEYFNESAIPQLGDYIGDEILFSREVTYYDNIILFKGYLTPRYVLKDYYTGVMAKKRSWEIAKESEALTRTDVYKLYIEASFSEKKDYSYHASTWSVGSFTECRAAQDGNGYSRINVVNRFLTSLTKYDANSNICHAFVRTTDGQRSYPVQGGYDGIILDLLTEVQGNSITFNFGFDDNFKSASWINKTDNEFIQSFYKYCASPSGRFSSARIYLLKKTYGIGRRTGSIGMYHYHEMPEAREDNPDAPQYSSGEMDQVIDWMFDNPKMGEQTALYQNDGLKLGTTVLKDNREITKWTVQFEYCSDTPDILVKSKFVELCSMVNDKSSGSIYLALAKPGFKYSLKDEKANADVMLTLLNITVPGQDNIRVNITDVDDNVFSAKVQWNNVPYTEGVEYGAWAICDEDMNILLAVNRTSNVPVYFNILKIRDTKVYADSWSQTVLGDIVDPSNITRPTSTNSTRAVKFLRRLETAVEEDDSTNESE